MKKLLLTAVCVMLLAASCNIFAAPTAGTLKTANGGVDWQVSNKLKNVDAGIDGLSISKLAFEPNNSEVIYASAFNAGLYVSKDGAGAWEQVLGQIPIMDFAIHPSDSQTIYAAGYLEERGRALVTRDGGKSWNEIFSSGTTGSSARGIAINPANPQQVVLALSQGELIISNDAGSTWRLVQNYNDRINRLVWQYEGLYVLVQSTGLFRSTDGANSFQLLTGGLQTAGNSSATSIFGSSISGYNQVAISASNPNVLYITTSQGLYRSGNAGATWVFVPMPLRQNQVGPTAVAIAPTSDSIVYVSITSSIYKTTDGGLTWLNSDTKTDNLINALLVNPELPQVAYAGVYTTSQ